MVKSQNDTSKKKKKSKAKSKTSKVKKTSARKSNKSVDDVASPNLSKILEAQNSNNERIESTSLVKTKAPTARQQLLTATFGPLAEHIDSEFSKLFHRDTDLRIRFIGTMASYEIVVKDPLGADASVILHSSELNSNNVEQTFTNLLNNLNDSLQLSLSKLIKPSAKIKSK